MQGKNIPAIALFGTAALFVLIGSCSNGWVSASRRGRSVSIGTSEMKYCGRDDCRTKKFDPDRMRNRDKPMYLVGKALFSWGMINMLLFIACAVLLGLGHSSSHIPPRIALFTSAFSLLLGLMFVAVIMAQWRGKPIGTPGYSFFIHSIGCVAGIVGGVMGWKKVAAGAAAMAGQAFPGQPMPGQPMPGQPMPGQPMPGQAPMAGQPMPGQAPMDPAMQAQAQAPMDPALQAQAQAPMDPALQAQAQAPVMDPAAQAQAPAACQTCGGAARWVPEYSRNYCDACQQYV